VAVVSANPAFGAADLSPVVPLTISVAQGRITELHFTNPEGADVTGTTSPDGTT